MNNKILKEKSLEIRLKEAEDSIKKKLGTELWKRLHVRARSSLVTSEVFLEISYDINDIREKRDIAGKGSAPEIDFSPAIISVFKAIEIELHQKIINPFREFIIRNKLDINGMAHSLPEEVILMNYLIKPNSSLIPSMANLTTCLESMGRKCHANHLGLLSKLKLWLQTHLEQPEQWWDRNQLALRLKNAVREYRNSAAHTARISPRESMKILKELWGDFGQSPGLITPVLRSLQILPVPDNEREVKIGKYTINKLLLSKTRYWAAKATDPFTKEGYFISFVPGDERSLRRGGESFKNRLKVYHKNIAELEEWFPVGEEWGRRVAIVSKGNLEFSKKYSLSEDEASKFVLTLAESVSVLHSSNLIHGFISPYTTFQDEHGQWILTGYGLIILAEQNNPFYLYPRTRAPEVRDNKFTTLTKPADVFSVAATACLMREYSSERNCKQPTPEDAHRLFPSSQFGKILACALQINPHSRPQDAKELFAQLQNLAVSPIFETEPLIGTTKMENTNVNKVKVLFVTAIPYEFDAVVAHFSQTKQLRHPEGDIYTVGDYAISSCCEQMAVLEVGRGRNAATALKTERAINFLKPEFVFFIGVAGGIKDVNLGDVIAAEIVKGYEAGKEVDAEFLPRGDAFRSSHPLVEQARATTRADWQSKIKSKSNHSRPKALVGTIVAGEKIITSSENDKKSVRGKAYTIISKMYSDALALETESVGFLMTIDATRLVEGIVIRGISDKLAKTTEHDQKWQPIAARNAAAFAFSMLDALLKKPNT